MGAAESTSLFTSSLNLTNCSNSLMLLLVDKKKYLQMRNDVHIIIDESQVRNFPQSAVNDTSDCNI